MTQNTRFHWIDKAESQPAGANEVRLQTEGGISLNSYTNLNTQLLNSNLNSCLVFYCKRAFCFPNHNTNSNLHLCTDTAESQPAGANEVRLQTEGGISLNSYTNLNTQLLNSNLNSCLVFYCKRAFCFGNVK